MPLKALLAAVAALAIAIGFALPQPAGEANASGVPVLEPGRG